MHVLFGFQSPPSQYHPIAVTIGNFDGVHRGHQELLQKLKDISQQRGGHTMVVTFENHPSEVLSPHLSLPKLTTLEHKLILLEKCGIDITIVLRFTEEFSRATAQQFLAQIYHITPYSHLLLGYDAVLGKDRSGTPQEIRRIGQEMSFEVNYLPEFQIDGEIVSSSLIRKKISHGELDAVAKLLGHRYSILSTVLPGQKRGHANGFATANINVTGLAYPPLGDYAVLVKYQGNLFHGIANLGFAPTIRNSTEPLLEVHLLDQEIDLYGKQIEVIFLNFIRPEKKFATM